MLAFEFANPARRNEKNKGQNLIISSITKTFIEHEFSSHFSCMLKAVGGGRYLHALARKSLEYSSFGYN
ncbi:hypothetical protein ACU8KH_01478 [Lachancea thermotolerans]